MELQENFNKHWRQLFPKTHTQPLLLAVSGGVDSMVMCHLFLGAGIPFAVAHCNFSLRGEASDGDEALIRNWCLHHGVTIHVTSFETSEIAANWKMGIQEAARKLRYDWFEILRAECRYSGIATAHHANDNVETLLMNLFRGCGISGLHGILPVNGHLIRPLLFAQKEELLVFAEKNGIEYRTDASNLTDDYLRNAVRRNIIPVVEEWFPNMITQVNESITRFGEAEQLYRDALEKERVKLLEQRGADWYIPIRKLKNCKPIPTILYELLHPYGFSPAQLPQIMQLLIAESGHYVASATHRVIKNRDFLVITTLAAETTDIIVIDNAPFEVATTQHHYTFDITEKPETFSRSADMAYLDLGKVTFPLFLRKWRTGDYCYPFGMGMKKKKISRILINEKTPLHDKEKILVLESDKRIAWIAGIRSDERFRVTNNSQKVLVVKRTPINNPGTKK